MKLILRYMKRYAGRIGLGMFIKLCGTMTELMIPYVMEYLIDDIAPGRQLGPIVFWGCMMLVLAVIVRTLNVTANRMSVRVAQQGTW